MERNGPVQAQPALLGPGLFIDRSGLERRCPDLAAVAPALGSAAVKPLKETAEHVDLVPFAHLEQVLPWLGFDRDLLVDKGDLGQGFLLWIQRSERDDV
jgi:hypothetical protein